MTRFTTYDINTGIITAAYTSPQGNPPALEPNEALLTDVWLSGTDYYIDTATGIPVAVSIYPIAYNPISASGNLPFYGEFTGIPVGTTVLVPPAANDSFGSITEVIVNDGTLLLDYNYKGTYQIQFRNFKFYDLTIDMEVT